MAWSDETIEQLISLWQSGLTTNEIAKELGMSKNSIVGKVHRLNLEARPSPIKKKDEEVEDTVLEAEDITKEQNVEELPVTEQNEPEEVLEPLTTDEPVEPVEDEDPPCIIKLADLNNHTCRWPIGDPKDEDFGFCGRKIRPGQTYCDEHSQIAYVKPIKK